MTGRHSFAIRKSAAKNASTSKGSIATCSIAVKVQHLRLKIQYKPIERDDRSGYSILESLSGINTTSQTYE
jgi:hypothetical protein